MVALIKDPVSRKEHGVLYFKIRRSPSRFTRLNDLERTEDFGLMK